MQTKEITEDDFFLEGMDVSWEENLVSGYLSIWEDKEGDTSLVYSCEVADGFYVLYTPWDAESDEEYYKDMWDDMDEGTKKGILSFAGIPAEGFAFTLSLGFLHTIHQYCGYVFDDTAPLIFKTLSEVLTHITGEKFAQYDVISSNIESIQEYFQETDLLDQIQELVEHFKDPEYDESVSPSLEKHHAYFSSFLATEYDTFSSTLNFDIAFFIKSIRDLRETSDCPSLGDERVVVDILEDDNMVSWAEALRDVGEDL